ncbi:MAG: apolipoprotein N-acyltransferase [Microbacterium sp.]|uniref:apolipoprotein N-acyltransferase n=1 Tax=Microbacterium sp. TaxID=51671 RepID=UPI003A87EE07
MPEHPVRPRPLLPLWVAVVAAIAGGLLFTSAYPPLGWWPMVFAAVPLGLIGLVGRSIPTALVVGLAFGASFTLTNLAFTARYLGPVPWLALSLLEAVLMMALAVPITLAYRWLPRVLPGRWWALVALPALVAGLWTLRELVQGTFPYGGFPWGRIGVTQAGGPLADAASWGGMSGLTFVIVFVCTAAIEYARQRRLRDIRTALPAALTLVALFALPQFPTIDAGTLRVGAAQGNGPSGYFDRRAANDVLNAQLAATAPMIGEDMDVLVWPEGAVDSDPTRDPVTASVLDSLAERIDAPLVIAAVTQRGSEYFNSSLLWEAGADDPVQVYDKRHPVPFGEYVPDRWLWRQFAPDLIDLIQREYTPGVAVPVFEVEGVPVGLAICFDVIYDDVVWDGANNGAEVFFFQTNNADFRGTSENLQQLSFARMRAVETGRSVVNISTVGTSQFIAPDGAEIAELGADVAGHLLADVPLRTGLTPAVVLGPWIHGVLGWGSAAVIVLLGVATGLRGRREKTPTR